MMFTAVYRDIPTYSANLSEEADNDLGFTIVRPFNWIGPRMDFIPGIDGPVRNLLRREPLKLVDGGESQRTFENPGRANGHIFNVGNPNNEVTVRQLAEMMTKEINLGRSSGQQQTSINEQADQFAAGADRTVAGKFEKGDNLQAMTHSFSIPSELVVHQLLLLNSLNLQIWRTATYRFTKESCWFKGNDRNTGRLITSIIDFSSMET
ncbi:hypothetical protein L6452_20265 [Arctium lappa]|uniref:Uncharacterized protein n=1 Tax=Arctium lappa TaxID=4217 RepID=A0ACB9BBA6_ARCLA|nr:hypothetical protein L6452_20265 [Arctium lappa]